MTIRKSNPYLTLVNSYLIDSPQPSSINYWWNLGSLLGLCLVIQIASGIFLAMHYSSNIELAFNSVEHIMRDVNAGWLIRYIHANGASFFFICLYIHIGKALYYGSYKTPRVLVWSVGVVIFILTIATAFMGYCLVYGQMSHWGIYFASNVFIIIIYIYLNYKINRKCTSRYDLTNLEEAWPFKDTTIIEIIYGSLLGDAHAEKRLQGKGTRITFYQEGSHNDYLLYLHSLIANLGFCNTNIPKIYTRLGKKGKIRKYIRFSTWTYTQFNYIYNAWYSNNVKILPNNLSNYLTPLALSIWIMNDGCKINNSLKLATNNFTLNENEYLIYLLKSKYNINASIHKTGVKDQFNIYIFVDSMPTLVKLIKPYIIPSMKYKLGEYL